MNIQINTLCFQYWRRLFWCLSSIREQVKPTPNITIRINTCLKKDRYSFFKKLIEQAFKEDLLLEWVDWGTVEGFDIKSTVRNRDVKETGKKSEYILWIDPDVIFHPLHFNFLLNNLVRYRNNTSIFSIGRLQLPRIIFEELSSLESYQEPVDEVFKKIAPYNNDAYMPDNRKVGKFNSPIDDRAKGFYQLIKADVLYEKGGYYSGYVDRSMWDKSVKYTTNSEKNFQRRFGSIFLYAPQVIHLEHYRGKEMEALS